MDAASHVACRRLPAWSSSLLRARALAASRGCRATSSGGWFLKRFSPRGGNFQVKLGPLLVSLHLRCNVQEPVSTLARLNSKEPSLRTKSEPDHIWSNYAARSPRKGQGRHLGLSRALGAGLTGPHPLRHARGKPQSLAAGGRDSTDSHLLPVLCAGHAGGATGDPAPEGPAGATRNWGMCGTRARTALPTTVPRELG
ncbi:hypothetical protein FB451DRAFT_1167622 [Mycena latifolia]|nr:hypothetical protein FB451DRAFT_1167622 [Mycena latifolia]